jgi:hypothetical protein
VVKVIDRRPKIKAHSGSKRPSGTEPEAVRAKLLGVFFVSLGFGTLRSARGVRKTGLKREATHFMRY